MPTGEIVIHNDVIGVVISQTPASYKVRDVDGRVFTFNRRKCTSVIKPAALAKLFKEKTLATVSKN